MLASRSLKLESIEVDLSIAFAPGEGESRTRTDDAGDEILRLFCWRIEGRRTIPSDSEAEVAEATAEELRGFEISWASWSP